MPCEPKGEVCWDLPPWARIPVDQSMATAMATNRSVGTATTGVNNLCMLIVVSTVSECARKVKPSPVRRPRSARQRTRGDGP